MERIDAAAYEFMVHELRIDTARMWVPLLDAPADRTLNAWCIVGDGSHGISRIAGRGVGDGSVLVTRGTPNQPLPPGESYPYRADTVRVAVADVLVLI